VLIAIEQQLLSVIRETSSARTDEKQMLMAREIAQSLETFSLG
jgi:hypothetical protein